MDGFTGIAPERVVPEGISYAIRQTVQSLVEPITQEGKAKLRNRARFIFLLQHQTVLDHFVYVPLQLSLSAC